MPPSAAGIPVSLRRREKPNRRVAHLLERADPPPYGRAEEAEIIDDSDVWWDWDEGQGPMDTEENRDEYPEGFLYPCCEADGNSDPCKPRYHEAAPKKRPRH